MKLGKIRWQCADYASLLFLPSHENYGCYGNRKSNCENIWIQRTQNYISLASSMKLGVRRDDNVLLMQVIFICCHIKIVDAMVMEIVKMLHR